MDDTSTHNTAKVFVDREACQTAATCLAYNIYELDDEAKAVILTKNNSNSDAPNNSLTEDDGFIKIENLANPNNLSPEEMREYVIESAKVCPFNAIIVKDDITGQIWPPLD